MSGENKTILVYGPPMSGKSINREALKAYFKADTVIDDPSLFELGRNFNGIRLVLANDKDLAFERKGKERSMLVPDESYKVSEVREILGSDWIEPCANWKPIQKTDFDRFFDLLGHYPKLKGYWDREKRGCDLDRVERSLGVLSSGEVVLLRCLVSIWMGGLGNSTRHFKIDFTDLAGLGSDALSPLIDWLNKPCWP